ncbi:MAG TPA: efflux RND transporter periplasmic adaptor subunit [Edaphobacter sp.]|jgi:RND family efflux transporter MFP subunit|nr:efflux RND transporter periplasmic adaptor subunit [Edaphobacter sp.]
MHAIRNTTISIVTILLAASTLLTGCKAKEEVPTTEVTVEAVAVAKQALTEEVTADAVLAPLAQAAITPKITSPVHKFYVQRGARVKAGELLAVLENRDLTAAELDNKGAYEQAQAAYATATKASVPEDYQKAEQDVAQTKANLDLQQSIVNARTSLFAQGAIPGRDLDTAKASLVQAQAAYDIAAQHFASQKAVTREAAIQSAKGQLLSAEGKYQGAQAGVGYSEIHSPIDGVVTDRPLFAGEIAAAGQPLLTVMEVSSLLAKTHLSQERAQRMHVGDEAEVSAPGVDEPFKGKVTLISPALDPGSTTVEVWIKVLNRSGELKAGTPVKVTIAIKTIQDALVVPTAAIVTNTAGEKQVMVIGPDSTAHHRAVELGISQDDKTQITKGLKEGEQVISSGAYAMDDGTKVKIGAADEKDKDEAKPSAAKDEGKI